MKTQLRVAQINVVTYGSTGRIMLGIADCVDTAGGKAYTFSTRRVGKKFYKLPKISENHKYFGSYVENNLHHILKYLTGYQDCFSSFATMRLLHKLKKIKPDVLHLHNMHSCYINMGMLFGYIKKENIPVVWTLHDCWAFTGQCPYFTLEGCEKWKTGCHNCNQYKNYPEARVDRTRQMYAIKKKWFTGVENMTIVTPSVWLADLARQSFLKDYPVKVINNGIDLSVFKPCESDLKKRYDLENKFVVLGVSFYWGYRKGLDVFLELSKRLDDNFKIVLVGTNAEIDKSLPENIISIHRTDSTKELAKIYSMADIFVNPTREENYPTVNMEALACGTPVVTFNTGGSPEILDTSCGSVVPCDDIDALEKEIIRICNDKPYTKEVCLKRAECFDMFERFKEYVELYKAIIEKRGN